MRKVLRTTMIASIAITILSIAMYSVAQNQGRGRGNFDPEQMRAMRMERMQTQLGVSDDEWKVIGPLVEDVMEKQRSARMGGGGMMGMMGGPGGPGGQGGPGMDRPERQGGPDQQRGQRGGGGFRGEPDPEMEALQTALESPDTSADVIKEKLTALRTARAKKEAALKTSRENLRKVLTIRQEAQMVMMGMLD